MEREIVFGDIKGCDGRAGQGWQVGGGRIGILQEDGGGEILVWTWVKDTDN